MMPAEHAAIREMVEGWASSSDPVAALRADERGGWRGLWRGLAELGAFSIAIPESRGGGGGTFADLAAVLSELSAACAPGPVLGSSLLAHLLAAHAPAEAGGAALAALISGSRPGAVVAPGTAPAEVVNGRISGDLGVIDGACADSYLLVPAHIDDVGSTGTTTTTTKWHLLDCTAEGVVIEPVVALDRSTPLAQVRLAAAPTVARLDALPTATVEAMQATFAAASACGSAQWAVRTASEYARLREQFGRTIGSFQAVKHLCAEMYCRAEQAEVAAWDAATALDEGRDTALASAVAATVALDAAADNTKDCIQVLGGIGYTWEHDAHLHLRRALALRQLMGGTERWARRVAVQTREGVRRHPTIDLGEVEQQRAGLRAEITEIAALPQRQHRAALADAGLIAPGLAAPLGRAASPAEQLLIGEELEAAGVEMPDLVIGGWALPTIVAHGTAAQIERFAMPTLRGDLTWCQLFSEPDAGSDLAALRTTATRTEGGWLLRGQKVWTTLAQVADFGICLARTNQTASKHRGISFFLVDMRSPGIDVRPLREITGDELFNEVFLDDVFVADDCLVGELDGGWRVTRTTLASERVEMAGGSGFAPNLEELIAEPHSEGELPALGRLVAQASTVRLLAHRSLLQQIGGDDVGVGPSVQKLVGVRHVQDLAEHRLVRSGPAGAAESDLTWEFLSRRAWSIAGGSTQIVLSVIGERALGLPRDV